MPSSESQIPGRGICQEKIRPISAPQERVGKRKRKDEGKEGKNDHKESGTKERKFGAGTKTFFL